MRRREMRRGQRARSGNWRADYLETRTVGSEEGGGKRAARAVPRQPPILLGTSVRKIDNSFFHHSPIFLCYVVLNYERSRGLFSGTRGRPSYEKKLRFLAANIQGSHARLTTSRPKGPPSITLLTGYASSTRSTIEQVVPIQATHW